MYAKVPYFGPSKTEYIAFHSKLQEFSLRVSYICGLESSGKLSPEQAYEQMKSLWQQLRQSKNTIGIGTND
ncbi:MAG: hypothetical protein F6K09_32520 [Merismopedia sp. SIO2A8]|nr:hypothetical protein [Merismopedia sp. SIO2A8]